MGARGCRLVRRTATYAAKGKVLSPRAIQQIQEECACETCKASVGYRVRTAEIAEENRRAAASRKKCAGCGCTRDARCVLEVKDAGGEQLAIGHCAAAGDVPGHKNCSACLTPELRVNPRALFLPDAETIAEMVRLGFARPILTDARRVTS